MPQIKPAPRTSLIDRDALPPWRCSRCSKWRPTRADVGEQAAVDELVEEAERRAAGQQVAAVGAAVVAIRDGRGDLSR